MSLALRPYQEEALDAVHAARARGVKSMMVALPTGTGKTVVFSRLVRDRDGESLILAHREELLAQAADKLTQVAPDLAMGIGFVRAEQNDVGAPVIVGSVPTLARRSRLDQLPRRFNTVVVDEGHHATADSYRAILDYVDADLVVGFTATPERADDGRLSDVFDEIVYARSIEQMIDDGYLCDLTGLRVELADLDLSKVKVTAGEYQTKDLGRALTAAHAPENTAKALARHAAGRKSIVFVPTVALCESTAVACRDAGFRAASLTGDTDPDRRKQIVRDLASGELQCVVNCDVLTEGFDEPSVDCVAIAAPTRSRIRYVQRIGRGTRIFPGKADCLILDLVGTTEELELQSLPDLFELDAPPKEGETVTDAKKREAAEHAEAAECERGRPGEQRARRVKLFDRRRLHWIDVAGRWALPAGGGWSIVLDPTSDTSWRVMAVSENRARILARDLDLGYAQGAAEEAIRRRQAGALANADAAWRKRKPSPGQRGKLRHLGVTEKPATAGEASDLIEAAHLADRLARLEPVLAAREETAA